MGRRRSFTIIELMVCLALLTMVGSVLAYKSSAMIQSYRFSSNVKELQTYLKTLKTLCIIYDAEVNVTLTHEEGILTVTTFSHERFPLLNKTHVIKCDTITPKVRSFVIKPTPSNHYSLIVGLDQREIKIKI